jgi:hypothetical protein
MILSIVDEKIENTNKHYINLKNNMKENNISVKKRKNILKIDLTDFFSNQCKKDFIFSISQDKYKYALLDKLNSYNINCKFLTLDDTLRVEIVEYDKDQLNINDKLIMIDTILNKFIDLDTINRFIENLKE